MTYQEILDMVAETLLPYAYNQFAEGEDPDAPYIVFMLPGRNDFLADNTHYVKVTTLTMELYTEYKDPELEESVEAVLESHGLVYDKTEVWIETEKLYKIAYDMEVIYNA